MFVFCFIKFVIFYIQNLLRENYANFFNKNFQIKIDVGSNIKAVMEYLEIMRSKNGHRDDALTRETFRSRSPSLSTARSSSRSGSGRGNFFILLNMIYFVEKVNP